MFVNNSLCSTLDHPGKPTISLALGQTVGKLVLNEDYYVMKRYIMSISHAMIMIHDLSHRINRTIEKDMVSILLAMNLLRDIL